MPRFVYSMVVVLAWLTLPLWVLSAAGEWIFNLRTMSLVANLASAATVAWAVLHMQHENSRLVKRRQDSWDSREDALIKITAHLIEKLGPEPEPDAEAGPDAEAEVRALRVVS